MTRAKRERIVLRRAPDDDARRFLRRVFSGDALAQTVGDDAFDSRAARDGGLRCGRELESFGARSSSETTARGTAKTRAKRLARFDAYFAELFARRARAADAARRGRTTSARRRPRRLRRRRGALPSVWEYRVFVPRGPPARTRRRFAGGRGGGAATGTQDGGDRGTRGPRRLFTSFDRTSRSYIAHVRNTSRLRVRHDIIAVPRVPRPGRRFSRSSPQHASR